MFLDKYTPGENEWNILAGSWVHLKTTAKKGKIK